MFAFCAVVDGGGGDVDYIVFDYIGIDIAIGIIIVDNILVEYILVVVVDDDYYIVTDYFLVEYILVVVDDGVD
jgi:hypothetical protein